MGEEVADDVDGAGEADVENFDEFLKIERLLFL